MRAMPLVTSMNGTRHRTVEVYHAYPTTVHPGNVIRTLLVPKASRICLHEWRKSRSQFWPTYEAQIQREILRFTQTLMTWDLRMKQRIL